MSVRLGNKLAVAASVAAIALVASVGAKAAPSVSVSDVTGIWTAANGAPVNGLNSNEILWGGGNQQSGYRFDGVTPPVQGPFAVGQNFTLGTFTHFNFPISPPSITDATLEVTVVGTATNGNVVPFSLTSTFEFDHNETPNQPNDVPDEVTPTANFPLSDTLTIDGIDYLFTTEGFDLQGATFLTAEGQSNAADLVGSFVRVPGQADVPVPATYALLGAGLIGLGLATRRRAKKQ